MPGNGYSSKVKVADKYQIVGFISSGTYGRVYKAVAKTTAGEIVSPNGAPQREMYAIKK
jgi:cyclin-dependent kinase 8/11